MCRDQVRPVYYFWYLHFTKDWLFATLYFFKIYHHHIMQTYVIYKTTDLSFSLQGFNVLWYVFIVKNGSILIFNLKIV